MNKKKWLNSKIFTITMVFVVCCFILTSLWAVEKIDFHSANAKVQNENDSLTLDEGFTSFPEGTAVTASLPPIADFSVSSTTVSLGHNVTFTDQSVNSPTRWRWTFEGVTPATSSAQNPTIIYKAEGVYDVTLVATNVYGSDSETKLDYITVVDPYCDSYADDQSFEWIAGVHVLGSRIDNTSGPSPYSSFTHIWVCLYRNEYASVLLTPGFGRDPYQEYWKIWIDYNHDDDFSDPGEEVFSGTSSKQMGAFLNGSFTDPVPTSAINGYTRMRVSMRYGDWPSDCAAFDYGEVEDYGVNIVDKVEPIGNTTVFEHISTNSNRRAMPFTMPENGFIVSVAMYHKAGSGEMILGLYDGEDAPQNMIGLTSETDVKGSDCWQVIRLADIVHVAAGTTVWLAWVYEDNPGTAYTSIDPGSSTPGRYDAGVGSSGMPETFGSGTQAAYIYSIYAIYNPSTFPPCSRTVGNTDVYESISTSANRRAMPFTMPMEGSIESVIMYHTGGTGSMILAVYDGEESPQNRLGITEITPVYSTTGWQEIKLTSDVSLLRGDTFWLAWVYENNPGIRYQTGSLGRYKSGDTWSGGMPYFFGSGSQENYIYSIYATYKED